MYTNNNDAIAFSKYAQKHDPRIAELSIKERTEGLTAEEIDEIMTRSEVMHRQWRAEGHGVKME